MAWAQVRTEILRLCKCREERADEKIQNNDRTK